MKKMSQKRIFIPFKWTAIVAYGILIVPTLLFFAGWLRWYWAVLFSGTLLFGAYWIIKNDYWDNQDNIEIPAGVLITAGTAFLLWILISGDCYISVGNYDTLWRNITFHDLVNCDWPVYYPNKNGYLCYYFVFWLPSAFIGKILGGLSAAYIALAGWFWIILMTVFLLIAYYFRDYRKSTLRTIIVFMIMWSGINVLGMFLVNRLGIPSPEITWGLNENYCDYFWVDGNPFNFYYRSNEDFIGENYNQIPIWLAVPLMLENRKLRNYAFLGLLIFPFSPWCTVGLALLMFADAIRFLIKEKSVKQFLKEAISVPNICAIISIPAAFICFFSIEASVNVGTDSGLRILPFYKLPIQMWQGLLIFAMCEFGIYYMLTWEEYKENFLYKTILPLLLIIPFFHIGPPDGRDFGMNVSLPMLYILMIFMIDYLRNHVLGESVAWMEKYKIKNIVLLFALGLSFTTPVLNWMQKIHTMNVTGSISVQDKSAQTFADVLGCEKGWVVPVSCDVDESVFFKRLAKPIKKENYENLAISENLSDIRRIENINEYFDYLLGKNCTVFIAVQDIPGFYLMPETIDRMKLLGFDDRIDVLLQKEYHSFIGVVANGQIVTEQIGGDEYISYYEEGQAGLDQIWMESGTWNNGNCAVININDGYYSVHGRGFNVVVKDNEANRIIDSVAFDTHSEQLLCTRKAQ